MSQLLHLLSASPHDYYYLAVDEFLDIKLPNLPNFISLSPQNLGINLVLKNSGRLLEHPSTQKFIAANSQKTGRQPAIIPFKPSAKIDFICQKNNWLLIANPSPLNRRLEDKIKFAKFCQLNQINTIPCLINPLNRETFSQAQEKFGAKLVVQTHFGWAGNSSYLVSTWNDITRQLTPGTIVKYSPFWEGYSLINNCCLTSSGLIQSPPGLQYTGLPSLTQNPLATVGRQWPSFAPTNIQNQVRQITSDFSKLLNHLHYRGFFGLDFFVHQDQVYLLECNPRLTASFAFYTSLEIACHLSPLFFFHLAEFSKTLYPIDINHENQRFSNNNIAGSEITLKNEKGATIKRYQQLSPLVISPDNINIDPTILANIT